MYVRQLSINTFRCFVDTQVELRVPGNESLDNLNLVLGDNGAGKSSFLRAIALTALSEIIGQSGFLPRHLVRRGGDDESVMHAELMIDSQDDPSLEIGQIDVYDARAAIQRKGHTERIESRSDKIIEGIYYGDSPSFFMLGYGATRRVDMNDNFDPQAQKRGRLDRYQRIAGLFEDHIALVPLHAWYKKTSEKTHDAIVDIINRLLPSQLQFTGEWEERELLFRQEGAPIPYSALSDGYRGFIGLIGDILYHLHEVCGESDRSLTDISGLVMIDEIDLHLHPTWQRSIGPSFSEVFPKLQFIFTSHSPIVVGTVRSESVIVLDFDNESGESDDPWPRVTASRMKEDVHGLNADQILVSSYFGLSSTRAPDAEKSRRKLELEAASGDKDAALEYLKSLSKKSAL